MRESAANTRGATKKTAASDKPEPTVIFCSDSLNHPCHKIATRTRSLFEVRKIVENEPDLFTHQGMRIHPIIEFGGIRVKLLFVLHIYIDGVLSTPDSISQ